MRVKERIEAMLKMVWVCYVKMLPSVLKRMKEAFSLSTENALVILRQEKRKPDVAIMSSYSVMEVV